MFVFMFMSMIMSVFLLASVSVHARTSLPDASLHLTHPSHFWFGTNAQLVKWNNLDEHDEVYNLEITVDSFFITSFTKLDFIVVKNCNSVTSRIDSSDIVARVAHTSRNASSKLTIYSPSQSVDLKRLCVGVDVHTLDNFDDGRDVVFSAKYGTPSWDELPVIESLAVLMMFVVCCIAAYQRRRWPQTVWSGVGAGPQSHSGAPPQKVPQQSDATEMPPPAYEDVI